MRRIGVFGGTFDPLHLGHLVIAEEARERCDLDEVIFVPSGVPPHKAEKPVTAARHRYLMTLLGTIDQPAFSVSRIELERRGVSYTVETLRALEQQERELYFIGGADAILGLRTWREPAEILRLSRIITLTRPGFELDRLAEALGPLYEEHRDRFVRVEAPGIEISSSDIRARVARGESIRFRVPEMVASYIERYGLYREASR